jgi:hypothetical protein
MNTYSPFNMYAKFLGKPSGDLPNVPYKVLTLLYETYNDE